MKGVARQEIDMASESFLEHRLQSGLIEQIESALRLDFERQIDIGIVRLVASRERAEQIQCRDARAR